MNTINFLKKLELEAKQISLKTLKYISNYYNYLIWLNKIEKNSSLRRKK